MRDGNEELHVRVRMVCHGVLGWFGQGAICTPHVARGGGTRLERDRHDAKEGWITTRCSNKPCAFCSNLIYYERAHVISCTSSNRLDG